MIDQIKQFRKKYTLALLFFVSGNFHAFIHDWTATSYIAFASLLLGIFGAADLVDKDKFRSNGNGQG